VIVSELSRPGTTASSPRPNWKRQLQGINCSLAIRLLNGNDPVTDLYRPIPGVFCPADVIQHTPTQAAGLILSYVCDRFRPTYNRQDVQAEKIQRDGREEWSPLCQARGWDARLRKIEQVPAFVPIPPDDPRYGFLNTMEFSHYKFVPSYDGYRVIYIQTRELLDRLSLPRKTLIDNLKRLATWQNPGRECVSRLLHTWQRQGEWSLAPSSRGLRQALGMPELRAKDRKANLYRPQQTAYDHDFYHDYPLRKRLQVGTWLADMLYQAVDRDLAQGLCLARVVNPYRHWHWAAKYLVPYSGQVWKPVPRNQMAHETGLHEMTCDEAIDQLIAKQILIPAKARQDKRYGRICRHVRPDWELLGSLLAEHDRGELYFDNGRSRGPDLGLNIDHALGVLKAQKKREQEKQEQVHQQKLKQARDARLRASLARF
jgi:hypothetical protein